MKTKEVILGGKAVPYLIYEDGRLWNTCRGSFVTPQVNIAGYLLYNLVYHTGRSWLAHTIVALHFVGDSPGAGYGVKHKDLDKRNNHWWNLEWVTHSESLLHARGARHCDPGRVGFKHSEGTLAKMSKAKFKPVVVIKGNDKAYFGSIDEFCEAFGTYRRHFNRKVNSIHKINGWSIRYA